MEDVGFVKIGWKSAAKVEALKKNRTLPSWDNGIALFSAVHYLSYLREKTLVIYRKPPPFGILKSCSGDLVRSLISSLMTERDDLITVRPQGLITYRTLLLFK